MFYFCSYGYIFTFDLCAPTFQLLAEHGEKDGEVDWARSLLEHLIKLLLFHIETS